MDLRLLKETQKAGQKISDTIKLHILAAGDLEEVVGKWCAFHLSNAETDNVLYDEKEDAVAAMRGRSKDHMYIVITPDGLSPNDATRVLMINRNPMIDTTAPPNVIGPNIYPRFSNLTEQQKATLKRNAIEEWKRQHG